jgi:hypothetical protein
MTSVLPATLSDFELVPLEVTESDEFRAWLTAMTYSMTPLTSGPFPYFWFKPRQGGEVFTTVTNHADAQCIVSIDSTLHLTGNPQNLGPGSTYEFYATRRVNTHGCVTDPSPKKLVHVVYEGRLVELEYPYHIDRATNMFVPASPPAAIYKALAEGLCELVANYNQAAALPTLAAVGA